MKEKYATIAITGIIAYFTPIITSLLFVGALVMDDSKEKELFAALKAWKKEPIEFELDKFAPIKIEGKLLFMSAAIYEELNGFVFEVSEEDYLAAIEAEIIRQDKEAK